MALIQVRIDEEIKETATLLFESMGMNLSTAIRVFLYTAIDQCKMPFTPTSLSPNSLEFRQAVLECQYAADFNKDSPMTLEEINEEIRLAREERKKRMKK